MLSVVIDLITLLNQLNSLMKVEQSALELQSKQDLIFATNHIYLICCCMVAQGLKWVSNLSTKMLREIQTEDILLKQLKNVLDYPKMLGSKLSPILCQIYLTWVKTKVSEKGAIDKSINDLISRRGEGFGIIQGIL